MAFNQGFCGAHHGAAMWRLVSVLLVGACPAASAQTIYKCENGAKISYGDQPCTSGKSGALALDAAPAPDPALQQRLRRQKALADSIDQQRQASAAQQARLDARQRKLDAQRARQCRQLQLHKKWADEDLARASVRDTGPLRIRARRRAEQLALECPA